MFPDDKQVVQTKWETYRWLCADLAYLPASQCLLAHKGESGKMQAVNSCVYAQTIRSFPTASMRSYHSTHTDSNEMIDVRKQKQMPASTGLLGQSRGDSTLDCAALLHTLLSKLLGRRLLSQERSMGNGSRS